MNKKLLKSLIIGSSILFVSSIGLGVGLSYLKKENFTNDFQNSINHNKQVKFNGQLFNSIDDAYNYAYNNLDVSSFNGTNSDFYTLNNDNSIHLFNSPIELNNYVDNNIGIISNCSTNEIENNLDPVDHSIYLNDLYKYNVDVSKNEIFDDNYVNIYKKNGGGYVVSNNNDNNARDEAKKSYLQIHKGYFFNGIYFKSKQDLEIYIRNVYVKQFVNNSNIEVNNKKYKKIFYRDESGKLFTSEPIDMSDKNVNRETQIANFLIPNAYKYLRIKNNEHETVNYLKYNKHTNNIEGNIGENVLINSLPILKKMNNSNKSLYVVDANINEEYDLFGPYFLNTDANISTITNPEMWTKSNDTPYEIVRSESINLLSSFLDLFLNNDINIYNQSLNHTSLFSLTNSNLDLLNAEIKLYDYLEKIQTTYNTNLLDDLLNFYNSLKHTKSYCTLYSIITVYNFLYDRLINYNASVECVLAFENYFEILTNLIQTIFESIFGDLLLPYNNPNGEKFNFAKFFGINQFGFDGNNIGSVLNGYDLIRDYKPLIAGCYVFMKAISNSQNILQVNYNSFNDNFLFNILEDGKNYDQNTSDKIRKYFFDHNICTQLDKLYFTFSNWSKLIDNDLLSKINNSSSNDVNSKLDSIINDLNQQKQNYIIPNDFYNDFLSLQKTLNVEDQYLVNDLTRSSNSFKIILESSYYKKRETNIDLKISGLKNAKDFINKNFNTGWTSTNSIFSNNLNAYKMSENFAASIRITSTSQILQETNIIEQVNTTKDNDVYKKFDIAEKIMGDIQNIGNSITSLINDVNNKVFNDVKDQIIVAGVMNICSSLFDGISLVTPPPANIIIKAASMVFSFISQAIGTAEQVIYEYVVNDSTKPIKYYWDGGLVMKRFWGLWKDEKRTIKDLKMQSPLLIISNNNKESLYFNKKNYDIGDEDIVKKEALNYILNNLNNSNSVFDEISSNFSWVYSLESNVNNINENNAFGQIYSSNNEQTLTNYIVYQVSNNLSNNITDLKGDELFVDGYVFNNKTDLEENLKKKVIDVIKPIYIAKLPDTDINNYPLDNQNQYHLPYPYFEPSNKYEEQLVCSLDSKINPDISIDENKKSSINVIQDEKYIMYDSNTNNSVNKNISFYESTINEIFANIEERFINSFDIESKKILKTNLINISHLTFDSYKTNLQKLDIFYIKEDTGQFKYFLNKMDAEKYLIKKGSSQNNNSLKVNLWNKPLYTFNDGNSNIYFDSIELFNKWFISKIIMIN